MLELDENSGLWFRPSTSDEFVLNEIFLHDVYGLSSLSDIETVLDIGGNIGAFAVQISRLFPSCSVTTVEPEPDNFSVLQKNCLNIDNIRIINKAVWSHSDGVEVVPDCGGTSVSSGVNSVSVDSISFDQLLDQFSKVDLMKIDIEGAEVEAILSASPESLRKINKITGEFHGYDPRWGDWVRYLGAFFELTIIPHPYPDHIYGGIFSGVSRAREGEA
jgi:FkbM family methyltransferase